MLKARSQERLRRPQGAVEVANLRKRHPRRVLPQTGEGGRAWQAAGQRLDSTRLAAAAAARGIVTYNNYKPVSTHTWPFKWAAHTHTYTHTDRQQVRHSSSAAIFVCLLPPSPPFVACALLCL